MRNEIPAPKIPPTRKTRERNSTCYYFLYVLSLDVDLDLFRRELTVPNSISSFPCIEILVVFFRLAILFLAQKRIFYRILSKIETFFSVSFFQFEFLNRSNRDSLSVDGVRK